MLEKPIEPETVPQIRADVTNKTAFVQKRSDIIFQDTLSGHWEVSSFVWKSKSTAKRKLFCLQHRWEFSV